MAAKSMMRRFRLGWQAFGSAWIATCCGCSTAISGYYPLDAGRAWRYAVAIHQGAEATTPVEAASTVTNLPGRTWNGRAVTPQESRLFDQVRLRFIADDQEGIAEIAAQSANDVAPRMKEPPNYVLKRPLREGTVWRSTWLSSQLGVATEVPVDKRIVDHGAPLSSGGQRYDDCVRVEIRGEGTINAARGPAALKVTGEEWFCAGVGFVKGEFREELQGFPEYTTVIVFELTG